MLLKQLYTSTPIHLYKHSDFVSTDHKHGIFSNDYQKEACWKLDVVNINKNFIYPFSISQYITEPGFPYCCVEEICVYWESMQIGRWNGNFLWAYIQSLSPELKNSYLQAARQGLICIRELLPPLIFKWYSSSNLQWKIKWNHSKRQKIIQNIKEKVIKKLSTVTSVPFNVLRYIVGRFIDYDWNCTEYISHGYENGYERNKEKEEGEEYYNNYNNYNNQPLPYSKVSFPFMTPRYILTNHEKDNYFTNESDPADIMQLNWMIERPDKPGMFYTPDEHPMKAFILEGREYDHISCYIQDKIKNYLHIPEEVAYYTMTFYLPKNNLYSNNQNHQNHQHHINNIINPFNQSNNQLVNFITLKKYESLRFVIILNDFIPKDAKIHFWISTLNEINYHNGNCNIKHKIDW